MALPGNLRGTSMGRPRQSLHTWLPGVWGNNSVYVGIWPFSEHPVGKEIYDWFYKENPNDFTKKVELMDRDSQRNIVGNIIEGID